MRLKLLAPRGTILVQLMRDLRSPVAQVWSVHLMWGPGAGRGGLGQEVAPSPGGWQWCFCCTRRRKRRSTQTGGGNLCFILSQSKSAFCKQGSETEHPCSEMLDADICFQDTPVVCPTAMPNGEPSAGLGVPENGAEISGGGPRGTGLRTV